MVLNPTITLDGIDLWKNGQLCLSQFGIAAAGTERWPALRNLLYNPDTRIGR